MADMTAFRAEVNALIPQNTTDAQKWVPLIDKYASFCDLSLDEPEYLKIMEDALLSGGETALKGIVGYLTGCSYGAYSSSWWNHSEGLVKLIGRFTDDAIPAYYNLLINSANNTNVWEYHQYVKAPAAREQVNYILSRRNEKTAPAPKTKKSDGKGKLLPFISAIILICAFMTGIGSIIANGVLFIPIVYMVAAFIASMVNFGFWLNRTGWDDFVREIFEDSETLGIIDCFATGFVCICSLALEKLPVMMIVSSVLSMAAFVMSIRTAKGKS